MQQEKIQVGARIPKNLHDQCLQRYDNMTTAINLGLDLLIHQNVNMCYQNENSIEGIKPEIFELQETRIKELQDQIKVNDENQTARLKEMQYYNETLKREHEDYKQMHNNYMMQMQTIINQKVIEGSGKKKWFEFWK